MKKVKIEWVDSKSGRNEWEYREELEPLKPVMCTTIGFLMEATPEYVTIAHTMSAEQVLGRITIPACCIKKRVWIK